MNPETITGLPAIALRGLSLGYAGLTRSRAAWYERGTLRRYRPPCAVISVGNLSAGGTGKTPLVLWLARLLGRAGYWPAVLTRGYRGGAERTGGVVSDGRSILMDATQAGDEPWLLARSLPGVPVLVGRNRIASAHRAVAEFGADVLLLDDGFQHLRLERDLDLVLMDAANPLGNGRVLPAGLLREPPSALRRADAVILTRADGPVSEETYRHLRRYLGNRPVFRCRHEASLRAVMSAGTMFPMTGPGLRDRRVVAFSGIGSNEAFSATVGHLGGELAAVLPFPDHHAYTETELAGIVDTARRAGAEWLVTTEKDLARLGGRWPFAPPLAVVGIETVFIPPPCFEDFVVSRVRAAHRRESGPSGRM